MDEWPEQLLYCDLDGRRIAAAWHHAPGKRIVVFCHGFRGDKLGPNRCFVRLARRLQAAAIGSLRFDQHGSGDSQGDFVDSSFDDWVRTTVALARGFLRDGYQVALLGQSMGGTAALVAAAELGSDLASVVAWMPDPSVDPPAPEGEFMEEGGQRVRWDYWREAHAANAPTRFREILAPTLVFFATDDAYVSPDNREALIRGHRPHQRIELLEGHAHSAWTYDQAERIIRQTGAFLQSHFGRRPATTEEPDG